MPTIAVVSDTHCRRWDEVHAEIRRRLAAADVAVHCGDFTHPAVVSGMMEEIERAVVVHGNSDPPELRRAIPYVQTLEVGGRRIGMTHPAWGGPEFELEELLLDFPDGVDAILFGHLHEPVNEIRGGILYLNPGQGYASFMVPATMALLTIDNTGMRGRIITIEPAR